MNRQQILLALALREAGVPLDMGQFDQRLLIQKVVCLLQYAGVHLGYRFRWYLRGPYCSELTSDAFWLAGQKHLKDELKGWQLDEASRQRIGSLKALFSGSLSEVAKHLELLASVLFIARTGQAKAEDHGRISHLLKLNDKPFSQHNVSEAVATLGKYGIAL